MCQFVMKKYNAEGTGGFRSLLCPVSPGRVTMWRAKLESEACFLSMELEYEEQSMIREFKVIDSLDRGALFVRLQLGGKFILLTLLLPPY